MTMLHFTGRRKWEERKWSVLMTMVMMMMMRRRRKMRVCM